MSSRIAVKAACSASLIALHEASRALPTETQRVSRYQYHFDNFTSLRSHVGRGLTVLSYPMPEVSLLVRVLTGVHVLNQSMLSS